MLTLLLLLWTGCDTVGPADDDDGNGTPDYSVALYDTSETTITVSEEDGEGIGYEDTDGSAVDEVTWSSDYTYVLDGFVFVNDGQTLNIEPGTVIKGLPGQGENASALIVARGGTIQADGEVDNPIIFTAESDDPDDPNDLPEDARGLWGGVIILGSAGLNSTPGETAIEGIPTSEKRGLYGGDDDEDDSGTFRYVSIRYGGSDIGAGNEINSLTMGGVGRGTTIEYVESYNNADDGFEWFGGTVNTRYLVSAFNADDAFDIDEGYRGMGQFFFALQGAGEAGRGCECDGGTDPETGQPYATPVIYNATFIGSGQDATPGGDGNELVLYQRDNNAASWANSVFAAYPGMGIEIEDLPEGEGGDARARFEAGQIEISGNIWHEIGGSDTFEELVQVTTVGDDEEEVDPAFRDVLADHLRGSGNRIADPQLRGISRTADGGLDPRPASGSPARSGAQAPDDTFYEAAEYVGAFGDELWIRGWTYLDQAGYVAE